MEQTAKKINISALDGFRALAIISVILYHLGFDWFKGGLLGVTMFFVLSGYLITGLLIKEVDSTGKISLKRFWIRRAKRLLPAVLATIIGVAFLCVVLNHFLLTKMRPDIVPSIFFVQNWWYVFRGLSYFESLGDPSPLVHFWSLAIEEQFYLVWPLLLIGVYKLSVKNKTVRRLCLALAILSAAAMVLMFDPVEDPTRVYYGTDTRAFSLLFGAWLAYVFPWYDFEKRHKIIKKINAKIFDALAAVALIVMLAFMIFIDGTAPEMYWGVLAITSVLTMFVLVACVLPDSIFAKVFGTKALVWIGKRSYGIYLWHLPVILILKELFDTNPDQWWFAILVILIVFIICAIQYKFIEDPIRNGDMLNKIKGLKAKQLRLSKKGWIALICCAVVTVFTIVGVFTVPDETYVPEEAIESTGEDVEHAVATVQQIFNPVLIGDSVPAAINLAAMYPGSLNDSVVSRTTVQGINVLQEYTNNGVLGNVVIVSLFSNHAINPGELESIYNITGPDRHLILINSCAPYDYCQINNSMILEFVKAHDDVELIDWFGNAMNNPNLYFYKDKIHLTQAGRTLYSQLIVQMVNKYLPAEAQCNAAMIPGLYPE